MNNPMPKLFGSLLVAASLSTASSALAAGALDPVRFSLGVNFSLLPNVATGVVAGASINDLLELAPGVRVGARSELGISFTNPAVGALSVAPVVTFDIPNGGIYVGPSLAIGFGGTDPSFGFGLRGGIEYDLNPELMIYAFTGLNISPSFTGNTAVGIDYDISEPLSAFGETRLIYGGGNAAWGFSVGLNYRLQ
jgi:hypothetical protein